VVLFVGLKPHANPKDEGRHSTAKAKAIAIAIATAKAIARATARATVRG
jgi:hypothetical protein